MPQGECPGSLLGSDSECRPALSADAAGIAEAIVAAWRASYVGLVSADFLQALDVERIAESWRSVLASSRAFRLVLVSERLVIGAASAGPARGATSSGVQPARAELYSINVHPQHWGRGAGRLLLRASEERLREAVFSQAILWVVAGNVRARRFYELAGWRPSREERTTSELTGSPLHEIRFVRDLCSDGARPNANAPDSNST